MLMKPYNSDLLALIVEDISSFSSALQELLADVSIRSIVAKNNEEAFRIIDDITADKGQLDFITTDIIHPDMSGGRMDKEGGIQLIREIRNRSDEHIINGSFRLSRIPIIIVSGSFNEEALELVKLNPGIRFIDKENFMDKFYFEISDLLNEYRSEVTSALNRVGFCIYWKDGKYRLGTAYTTPKIMKNDHFVTYESSIAELNSRIILFSERSQIAQLAVEAFEILINTPNITEPQIQAFLRKHPEFILSDQYNAYWSEPYLKSVDGSGFIKPDFILQPQGDPHLSWNWSIVDLKRPNVNLFSNHRFHRGFSYHVNNLINQLKDYADYFSDPRNEEELKKRFGGIVPKPKLVGIIGRLPKDHRNEFAVLRSRTDGVCITTYDEILELRRCHVEKMQALGL